MHTSNKALIRMGIGIAVIAGSAAALSCNAVLGVGDFHLGVCKLGERRCAGDTPQMCDENGQWHAGTLCDAAKGQHCSGGGCVVECTPGDLRCSDDDQPQTCAVSGIWQDNGIICESRCGGCDNSTGSCATAEGAACDDGDSCTMSSSCQAGVCTRNPEGDHAWAHWDLKSAPPSPRYIWTSDVVYDKQTHLTWQRNVPAVPYNWADAKSYCACLNGISNNIKCDSDKMLGYSSGWRLPSRIELASIVDYAKFDPTMDTTVFPNTPGSYFWSSSSYAGAPGYAWNVDFSFGYVNIDDVGNTYRARCVR